MKIEPEGVKVLIRPKKVEKITEGGIVIPDSVQDSEKYRKVRGTIVAIGPAVENTIEFEDGGLKVGDEVIYARHSGVFVQDENGEDLRLANDKDILARIS